MSSSGSPAPAEAGPFSIGRKTAARSKGGCITCKNRKKKCDETKLAEHGDSCERCFKSSYKCEWQAPPSQRPLKVFRSRAAAAQDAFNALGPAGLSIAANLAYGAFLQNPTAVQTYAAMMEPSASVPLPDAPPATSFSAPYPHPSLPSLTPAPSFSDSSLAPATASNPPQLPPVSLPAPPSSLPAESFDAIFSRNSAFGDLFDDVSTATPPQPGDWAAPTTVRPAVPSPAYFGMGGDLAVAVAAPSGTAALSDDAPELSPLYRVFTAGMCANMPPALVDLIADELAKLAASSSLGRHAGQAMVTLIRIHHLRQRARFVQPHHAAAFARRQQELRDLGCHHFQKGLEHLSRDELPLPNRLLGCFDLLTYQFDQFGTEAAQAILFLGETFITQELGPRPRIHFSSADAVTDLLCPYAWLDAIQSMVTPKRRTLFSFSDLPGDSPVSTPTETPWKADEDHFPPHPCLPITFMLCLVAIINLDVDRGGLTDDEVKRKANAIEQAARGWTPPSPKMEDLKDSGYFVEEMATVEMWRHAIIIFLYQVIHQHTPISRTITDSLHQILKLGVPLLHSHVGTSSMLDTDLSSALLLPPTEASLLSDPSTQDAEEWAKRYFGLQPCRDGAWFIAGTCATLPRDRDLCRRAILAAGPDAQGYKDNVAGLERIWHEMDAGRWGDWRELLQREGMFVSWW
ncbi:hypothetical protein JCM6882_003521 [Rhodosporidiobolus microsporus]